MICFLVFFALSVNCVLGDLLSFDEEFVSRNGYIYLDATAPANQSGCGAFELPCRDIVEALKGNTSNYFNNNFYFARGNYTHPVSSVPATAPSQEIVFTGQDDGIIIRYNASSTTYGFVVSMGSLVNYTRLTYAIGYYGTENATRSLIRTNGGTVNANNCNFTMITATLKCSLFRNAYGGTISLINCAFRNIEWKNANDDWGCLYGGGVISGDFFVTNTIFSNLTSDRGTPVVPFYVSSNPLVSGGVANLTISGGTITNITVGVGSPVIHISSAFQFEHSSSIQDVTFSNLSNSYQDATSAINGFIFSLNYTNVGFYSNVTIAGNKFININGIGLGGVLYAIGSADFALDVDLQGNTFTNCSSTSDGGALFFDSNTTLNVINNVFTGCRANRGGAIFIDGGYNSGRVTLKQNRFYNNVATVTGADIFHNGSEPWDSTSFGSTCGNCTSRCFVNTQSQSENKHFLLIYDQQCTTEVYVSGIPDDDNASCIRAGKCGSIQYIISTGGTAVTFIGVGNVRANVTGLSITANRTILGDSRSDSLLVASYNSTVKSAFSINNGILILNTLTLVQTTGGEFVLVTRGDLSIVNCEAKTETVDDLSYSFIHANLNTQVKIIGSLFSDLSFSNGSVIYLESGSLTLSTSTFLNIYTQGNGACVNGRITSAIIVISIEDWCIFGNCSCGGRGGAISLNLTTGASFALLSTRFFGNKAVVSGGAIDLYVSNLDELGNLVFDHDVHFYNNIVGTNSSNNVHLETPPVSHYCFTPIYNLRRFGFFDYTRWTFQRTATDIGTVADELLNCQDRCGGRSAVNCSAIDQCWYDTDKCVPHPCLDEYSGQTSSPCNGLCVFNEESRKCSVDGCSYFSVADCANHSDEGCGIILGRCLKHNETITPGVDKIKSAFEKLPSHGRVYLTEGTFDETNMIIGAKELWVGNDGTLASIPTVRETSTDASMIIVSVGGGLDINNLTLTSGGFNSNSNASLIYITEGRLVLRYITVRNRRGTYCAIYAERPREALILNCIFLNITHDTAKGGAALGINLLNQNGFAQIANTTFDTVWVEGIGANTRFGGAVWLEAHGSEHVAEVILCSFTNISTTDNAGALELYSDDNSGSMLCESTTFLDCYTTKGGGATSCRGRPVAFRNCSFERCKAGTAGGAIYHGGNSDNYIEACTFTDCSARNASNNGYGNAAINMYTSGLVVISDCVFNRCFIEKGNMSNINVDSIVASVTGFSNLTVSGCQFLNSYFQSGSTGYARAGALLIGAGSTNNNVFVQGCIFQNNSGIAESPFRTGALEIYTINVILKNCTFTNNIGQLSGGVTLSNPSITYFANVNFSGNSIIGPNPNSSITPAKDLLIASLTSPETARFEYVCYTGGDAVSIPSGLSVPGISPSTCLTSSNAPPSTPKNASSAEEFLSAITQNVLSTVTVNVVTDFVVPPVNILAETITIASSNPSSPVTLTANDSTNNIFAVSTGSLSVSSTNFLIEYLGNDRSLVRLFGNGSVTFDSAKFMYNATLPPPPPNSSRFSNQDARLRITRTRLFYFEFGTLTITKSSFSDFVFSDQGNVIYFHPSSRGRASLTIADTNFTNIRTRSQNNTEYPRYGVAVFVWVEAASNKFNLSNIAFTLTKGPLAIILPNLADLEYSGSMSNLTFDVPDVTNVYYGTSFDDLDNPEGNSLCNDTLLNLLIDGGIGTRNVHLCLGGSTSCTADTTRNIRSFQELCPGYVDPDAPTTEAKKPLATGVIVAIIVVVAVVVVVIVVAIAFVAWYKIKSDKEKYQNMEKKESAKNEPTTLGGTKGTVSPMNSTTDTSSQYTSQYVDKTAETQVEEMEEEVEDDV